MVNKVGVVSQHALFRTPWVWACDDGVSGCMLEVLTKGPFSNPVFTDSMAVVLIIILLSTRRYLLSQCHEYITNQAW
jgi:hypothetical protein